MKKLTSEQRILDVKRSLRLRLKKKLTNKPAIIENQRNEWRAVNDWIDKEISNGLEVETRHQDKKGIIINLPERLDFYKNYDRTVQYMTAIRKLVGVINKYKSLSIPKKAYKIKRVNFDNVREISTSAALVLTAEMSRWDSSIRKRLRPEVDGWDKKIYSQLTQLGFFDLFENKPSKMPPAENQHQTNPSLNFVKYIKGVCGDASKTRALKDRVQEIIGEEVKKWTFLRSGLDEAITNVSHHAYPQNHPKKDKNWYLTGSYDKERKEMKIAFFDQGAGIPNTLQSSEIWEKVLSFLSRMGLSKAENKLHSTLLKAAVEVERTRTGESDRGKGLQDLLEFIKQRGNGYLSILSYNGLYKFSTKDGRETIKSESFDRPICGTLIIWCVTLNGN
ncbi:hypothetical protein [Zobellella sp. An-6]|uniref:hypothetical protein n=1 Tax=Zobellella sp. An-6 TaxID=3400218 RepID=UPI0040435C7E